VNGNGKGEAEETFDSDKYKDFGFRLNQAVGEIASVGGFFYYGKEKGLEEPLLEQNESAANEVTYYGPDVNVEAGPLTFTGQYLFRKDTNPFFREDGEEVQTNGWIAELIVAPHKDRSRLYFTGLYNQVDSELDSFDYETLTGMGTYLLSRNLRLNLEYTRDLLWDQNRFVAGLVTAF
ncbi:MAG: hypothetical protein WAN36_13920, partial [Calditrichia bacterium]